MLGANQGKTIYFVLIFVLALCEGLLLGQYGATNSQRQQAAVEVTAQMERWNDLLGVTRGMTEEEIRETANRRLEESREALTIAPFILLQDGTAIGSFDIGNAPESGLTVRVLLICNDTEEVVYASGLIDTGYAIPKTKLTAALPQGSYSCTAYFECYFPDSALLIGTLAKSTMILVEN